MIKSKWIGKIAALLMAVAVLFLGVGYSMPSLFEGISGPVTPAYVYAMDKTKVMDIQIIAEEEAWANMLENARSEEYIAATVIIDGEKLENVGIRPKGNSSLSMVAQDSTTDRYSFKIEFDHYISGQTWLGLDKIAINNMQGDASYMKEYLSYDLMNYLGVNTPLYAFSNISVNGDAWGFYLAVEALEDSYAVRLYGNNHGKLYKPENMDMGDMDGAEVRGVWRENQEGMQTPGERRGQFIMPEGFIFPEEFTTSEGFMVPEGVTTPGGFMVPEGFTSPGGFIVPEGVTTPAGFTFPEGEGNRGPGEMPGGMGRNFGGRSGGSTLQYTDDEIESYSAIFDNAVFPATDNDYRSVINALKKLNAGDDLEVVVDIEANLKYFAAHTVIVNLDSYVSNMAHNYYLYEEDGRLTMLPWDFNLAFGGFQSGNASSIVNFPIDTPVSGVSLTERPLLAKLLEVPAYLTLYHEYLGEIVDGYFNSGHFNDTIDSLNTLIASYIETDPSAFYDINAYQNAIVELKKLGTLRAESIQGQLTGIIPSTTDGQNANPETLVDASSLNLSALGSMGGGMGGGRNNSMENRLDR